MLYLPILDDALYRPISAGAPPGLRLFASALWSFYIFE
jgi:hypothetical protein